MKYSHTQIGTLMIVVLIIVCVIFGIIGTQQEMPPIAIAVLLLVLVMMSSMLTLTVKIDEQYLRLKFGYGLFWRKWKLETLAAARPAKHAWWHGWGIRFVPWKKMWIYNLSGFDVVEVTTKNGRRFRVGTDEPQRLAQEIEQAIREKNS